MALDIASLRNISSPIIEEAVRNSNLSRAEEQSITVRNTG